VLDDDKQQHTKHSAAIASAQTSLSSTLTPVYTTYCTALYTALQAKAKLRQAVEWPLRYSAAFTKFGLSAPRGILLYGPPGCSKTTLVRAAATAAGATFVSLSGADV
jgi:SpoVK/Ycf46/Vps4 family AAA+-type ATPase